MLLIKPEAKLSIDNDAAFDPQKIENFDKKSGGLIISQKAEVEKYNLILQTAILDNPSQGASMAAQVTEKDN